MPYGVLVDSLAVALGGLIGARSGDKIPDAFKEKLNLVFAVCSMGMGVVTITQMQNMPAVVLSLILGTAAGVCLRLNARIERAGALMQRGVSRALRGNKVAPSGDAALLVTAIVLFCASGTGIYGSIVSGMSGDHSILISKSILDLFTALIFACSLGAAVAAIAVPQCGIFLALFLCAKLIFPLTTPAMVADFKACGGLIMLATGLRMAKLRDFPIADMIPALLLVWPISAAWAGIVAPLPGM